ncbi:MAG: hypothetical protein V4663_05945 [Bacteroidota bacterium]
MEILNSLQVSGQVTFDSITVESTGMDVLVAVSGLVKKRTLGTMALENVSSFNTKIQDDARFLQTVGLTMPSIFNTVTSATVGAPSLATSFVNQTAKTVFAAPNALNGTPSFRLLVASDLPDLSALYSGTAHTHTFASLTSKPTTIAGYGITDFLSQLLTGFALGTATAIDATDTVLTAFGHVQAQINAKANLASPTFTGVPLAPTAVVATNTTQIATTAFVKLVVAAGQTLGASVSGSAATLTTARTIWGQSFNGSANISGNMTGVGSITSTGNWFTTGGVGASTVAITDSGVSNDPYGLISVSRATTSNFGYYGMTRNGQSAWTLGIDTGNKFIIGQGADLGSGAIITNIKLSLDVNGNLALLGGIKSTALATGTTPPATTGTTRSVVVDANGLFSSIAGDSLYLLAGASVTANQILRLNGSSSGTGIVFYNQSGDQVADFYSNFGSGKGPNANVVTYNSMGMSYARFSIVPNTGFSGAYGWVWADSGGGSYMQLNTLGQLVVYSAITTETFYGQLDWSYITSKPTIPTNTNQLTNGSGFITSSALSGYLPLTGGTITGNLSVTGTMTANGGGYDSHRVLKDIDADWKGSAIDEISKLKVRSFNYKNKHDKYLGLIIDEVPNTISKYLLLNDGNSVNLYTLHGLSLLAHQQTKTKLEKLEDEVKDLKSKLRRHGLE